MAPFRYTISHPKQAMPGHTACGLVRKEAELPVLSTTPTKKETIEVVDLTFSNTGILEVTMPLPDPGPSALQLLKLWSLPAKNHSLTQSASHPRSPVSTSLANDDFDTEATNGKNQLWLPTIVNPVTIDSTGSVVTTSKKLGFLDLPADVRVRIYRYLFDERQSVKFYPSARASMIKARYLEKSGAGLRFTCQAIEAESWPIYHKNLQWTLRVPEFFSVLQTSRFHDMASVRSINLSSKHNLSLIKAILSHKNHFPQLERVHINTCGVLQTKEVPSRMKWRDFQACMLLWNGVPRTLEAIIKQPRKTFEITLWVKCQYCPYMKGKVRYWHDKRSGTLWSSTWKVNFEKMTLQLYGRAKTEVFNPRASSECKFKRIDEQKEVMKYAGQSGNPFTKR